MKVTMTWHYEGREFKPITFEYGFIPASFAFDWRAFDSDGIEMRADRVLIDRLIKALATGPTAGRFGYDGGYFAYTTEQGATPMMPATIVERIDEIAAELRAAEGHVAHLQNRMWEFVEPYLNTRGDCEAALDIVPPGYVSYRIRRRLYELHPEE